MQESVLHVIQVGVPEWQDETSMPGEKLRKEAPFRAWPSPTPIHQPQKHGASSRSTSPGSAARFHPACLIARLMLVPENKMAASGKIRRLLWLIRAIGFGSIGHAFLGCDQRQLSRSVTRKRSGRKPSVDAPEDARVKLGIGGSRMLPSVRPVCAVVMPLARMGVREPDPHHPGVL